MHFSITKDTMSPELRRILAAVKRPRALLQAGAKATQKEITDHLRRLQARGNKKGWPSQNFFSGKPDSVVKNVGVSELSDAGFTVSIADPRFVHRIEGGTVPAKRKKFLAIPLTAEAYAKAGKGSIRESMPGLFVVKFKRGLYLVKEVAQRTRAGATGGRKYNRVKYLRIFPMFKLVKSVTHRKHPEEMPDRAQIGRAARMAMLVAAEKLFGAK